MKYIYWVGAGILVAVGIYVTMLFGLQPQDIPKIQFSQVKQPEDLGKGIYERLRLEIKSAPILFLGVTPNHIEDLELWRGFLEANNEPGMKYDVIVVEPMLPYVELIPSNMRIDLKKEADRFVEGVKAALAEGHRVAVIVPAIYSSQILKGNPADRLKTEFKLEFTSFSVTKFPVTVEQETDFEPKCVMDEAQDVTGENKLGCMIRQMARKTYRKKLENNKYSGLMSQTGGRDYLVLLNRN